jgi:hypothetical protein
MRKDKRKQNQEQGKSLDGENGNKTPHPLEDVIATPRTGSVLEMQTGLFSLGRNRALQSGTAEPRQEDILALTDHARAMAKQTYRDKYDPARNAHDAMHETEYRRDLAQREEAEKAEQHAAANLREADVELARTPKAGPKPAIHPGVVLAFIAAITLSVAPTLHDTLFHTLPDDLLVWFASLVSAGFVGAMLTLAILGGRRSKWTWVGVAAGAILGIGLGAVRLSQAEDAGEVLFALGLTVVEISSVLLLEWLASGFRTSEEDWAPKHAAETEAIAARDAAQSDLTRWQERLKELNNAIVSKIAFVEDRHNRNIHIAELEKVAIKAVLDGYNAGIAENVGRIRGVRRRTA